MKKWTKYSQRASFRLRSVTTTPPINFYVAFFHSRHPASFAPHAHTSHLSAHTTLSEGKDELKRSEGDSALHPMFDAMKLDTESVV